MAAGDAVALDLTSETNQTCNSGTRVEAVRAIASDAQRNYADAIAVTLGNELYASEELRELELELVRTIELIRARDPSFSVCGLCIGKPGGTPRLDLEPWRSWMDSMALLAKWELPQPVAEPGLEQSEPRDVEQISSRFYEGRCLDDCLGRQSLRRLLAYEIATSAPLQEQVEAFIRIADWERGGSALERYQRALKMLQEAGAQTLIDEFFSPKIPVVLPYVRVQPSGVGRHTRKPADTSTLHSKSAATERVGGSRSSMLRLTPRTLTRRVSCS